MPKPTNAPCSKTFWPTVRKDFQTRLDDAGIELLRPARKGEKPRAGTQFFKPLRQVIEAINWTYKGHLGLDIRRSLTDYDH